MPRYAVDVSRPMQVDRPDGQLFATSNSFLGHSDHVDEQAQFIRRLLENETFMKGLHTTIHESIQESLKSLLDDQKKVCEQATVIEALMKRLEVAIGHAITKSTDPLA